MHTLQLNALGAAIGLLGESGFAAALIDALGSIVPLDHLALLRFDAGLAVDLVGAASLQRGNQAAEAGRLYARARFFRHDPGIRIATGMRPGSPVLFRLRASEIENTRYRDQIYRRFGLRERLSMIDQVRGRWLMVNLYRKVGHPPFSAAEVATVTGLAGLLLPLAARHAELIKPAKPAPGSAPSVTFLDELLADLGGALSPRERAVCARALAGLTMPGIAADLGVAGATVATLRRRAYAKLGITSLNELFALCIARLAHTTR